MRCFHIMLNPMSQGGLTLGFSSLSYSMRPMRQSMKDVGLLGLALQSNSLKCLGLPKSGLLTKVQDSSLYTILMAYYKKITYH